MESSSGDKLLSVTQMIIRRCKEMSGSTEIGPKLLPLVLYNMGCRPGPEDMKEIWDSVPKKKFNNNKVSCNSMGKLISQRIKKNMYKPLSKNEVDNLIQKLDVKGTMKLGWLEFQEIVEDLLPELGPGDLNIIRKIATHGSDDGAVNLSFLFRSPERFTTFTRSSSGMELEAEEDTLWPDEENEEDEEEEGSPIFNIYKYMHEVARSGIHPEADEDILSPDEEDEEDEEEKDAAKQDVLDPVDVETKESSSSLSSSSVSHDGKSSTGEKGSQMSYRSKASLKIEIETYSSDYLNSSDISDTSDSDSWTSIDESESSVDSDNEHSSISDCTDISSESSFDL